ncbi:MAG: pectate lyase [Sphingobacteriaceae bacterium]|nr:pectate lyase [Sphingobacteriaceae bacterium]
MKANIFLYRLGMLAMFLCCSMLVNGQHISDNTQVSLSGEAVLKELIADNMLICQRSSGGWPKAIGSVKLDYKKKLSTSEIAAIRDDFSRNDATIDNGATVKEIRFLAEQYKQTSKKPYLEAVQSGLLYLLKAQYPNGGWPQFFPDTSGYRKHITFNDNAMVNVLSLLQDVSERSHFMDVVDLSLSAVAKNAVSKGIKCIVNTQVKVDGKLTAWCAQHDNNTLLPANARSYELISLSGMESSGIIEFLMRQKNPSEEVKAAIVASVNWLKTVELKGLKYVDIPDSSKPKGYDRLLLKDPDGGVWARFYEVKTNEPFVSGRDGIKKKDLNEIEYERRAGYAWYGTWPKSLLNTKYPKWAATNLTKSTSYK